MPRFLSEKDRRGLSWLQAAIAAQRPTAGAIGAAKGIVNQIYDAECPIEELEVAVHMLGPVPVYVLPDLKLPIMVHDNEVARPRDVFVGIYQDDPVFGKTFRWPTVVYDRLQFLRSLERDLPTIFLRYFEDVTEYLFDIQHHLPFPDAIKACGDARAIVATSIRTKLDEILNPSRYRKAQPSAAALAEQLARDFADSLAHARLFSSFVLLQINRLYELFSFKSEAGEYRNRLREVLPEATSPESANDAPNLALLKRLIAAGESSADLQAIHDDGSLPSWLRRIASFTDFVNHLEQEGFSAVQPSIFLSAQHDVRLSDRLGRLLRPALERASGNRVRLLTVHETRPGFDSTPLIASRIWQSESIAPVLPEEREGKGLSWVIREVDYADRLDKRIVALLEASVDLRAIVENIGTDIPPLWPGTRRRADRPSTAAAFILYFSERHPFRFKQKSEVELDGELARLIESEAREALDRRVRHLLYCLLNFVGANPEEIMAIREIHRHTLATPLQIEQLAPFAFPGKGSGRAHAAFRNLRKRVIERTISLDGRVAEVFSPVSGTRKYQTNFPLIVSHVRPDLQPKDVLSLIASAFRQQLRVT